jgi:hypothetical protein
MLPVARSEVRKHSFAVRAVTKWNRLPDENKNEQDPRRGQKAPIKHSTRERCEAASLKNGDTNVRANHKKDPSSDCWRLQIN